MAQLPGQTQRELGRRCLAHLEQVVAVDSQSDERSRTVPTTPGQRVLSDALAAFYGELGLEVIQDEQANVIARLPGRGAGAEDPALALMVHLDTARGTAAVPSLEVSGPWRGGPVPYPANARLQVDLRNYPSTETFLGQQLVYGPGTSPFGLDDKLGLAECMTLATVLTEDPPEDHPPLVFVARPDEEVGREEALYAVIEHLQALGCAHGYTVDGIQPLEVNTENFFAGAARVTVPWQGPGDLVDDEVITVRLGGVNTHGATAAAEGYRSALRFAAELHDRGLVVAGFQSDAARDCDGDIALAAGPGVVAAALTDVVGPHVARGASVAPSEAGLRLDGAVARALDLVAALLASEPGFTVRAEDSEGRDGYSNPYRLLASDAGLVLDIRVRDFREAGLAARRAHLEDLAAEHGLDLAWTEQYRNMGERLAEYPELLAWAVAAGEGVGPVRHLPIRGGTGVDPFLDAGIPLANLGTGYFAPESEKEFTSVEMMGAHVQWLYRLVQLVGGAEG